MEFPMLDIKQKIQLIRLCREFQPFMPFDEVVFLELVSAAREYCDRSVFPFRGDTKEERFQKLMVEDLLAKIKSKYYLFGIKPNDTLLTNQQHAYILKYIPRVKIPSFGYNDIRNYRQIEKILFIKIVRACRDYVRAKMSKEAETALFEKLSVVYDAMSV